MPIPSKRSRLTIGLLAAIAAPVSAFWRLPCLSPLVVARMDPIVNPGKVSGHLHTVMGGNAFGFDMDFATTQESTCSSCKVTKDLSNYWVPQLYYRRQDGTFTLVKQSEGALIYYLQRRDPKDPEYANGLLAFPEGFRMLAGNPMFRTYNGGIEQQAVNYHCLGTTAPETNGFPDINCPDGLRAQIFFPSCWNGVDLDTADHKSHMAYPSNYDSGFCPPNFPKRFISLSYEITFETNAFSHLWYDGKNPFVWAMGDPTGYGFHGDFLNGWDVPTLQRAVNECTDLGGELEDCPVFEFFSDDSAKGCKIVSAISEKVYGTIDALPGCNLIQPGPASATPTTSCDATTVIGTAPLPYKDLTASKGFKYMGCGIDSAYVRSMNAASKQSDGMTNEMCVDFCVSKGYTIAGTEYGTGCYCGNSFPVQRGPFGGIMGNCLIECGGEDAENCGGPGAISLYQECTDSCENQNYIVNQNVPNSAAAASNSLAALTDSPAAPTDSPAAPTDSPAAATDSAAAPTDFPAAGTDSAAAPTDFPAAGTDSAATHTDFPAAATESPAAPSDSPAAPTGFPAATSNSPVTVPTNGSVVANSSAPTPILTTSSLLPSKYPLYSNMSSNTTAAMSGSRVNLSAMSSPTTSSNVDSNSDSQPNSFGGLTLGFTLGIALGIMMGLTVGLALGAAIGLLLGWQLRPSRPNSFDSDESRTWAQPVHPETDKRSS